jgi:hypothetical protein
MAVPIEVESELFMRCIGRHLGVPLKKSEGAKFVIDRA